MWLLVNFRLKKKMDLHVLISATASIIKSWQSVWLTSWTTLQTDERDSEENVSIIKE